MIKLKEYSEFSNKRYDDILDKEIINYYKIRISNSQKIKDISMKYEDNEEIKIEDNSQFLYFKSKESIKDIKNKLSLEKKNSNSKKLIIEDYLDFKNYEKIEIMIFKFYEENTNVVQIIDVNTNDIQREDNNNNLNINDNSNIEENNEINENKNIPDNDDLNEKIKKILKDNNRILNNSPFISGHFIEKINKYEDCLKMDSKVKDFKRRMKIILLKIYELDVY